ncbi:MAG TPA: ribonucleotide-diphosphate reductase subunit beta [Ktedonobacteraceae bacterium]|nr:ribonucleotide-diphosphate reductase subunit beta [Ktedonobacteraceae bacterium]
MSIDMPLEQASLQQLQQTPIDNVLRIIDEGLVHLPSYRELYYRWERQQWRAQDIDFSEDQRQWANMTHDEHMMRIYGLSAFFQGEACVTDTLAPYILAMPEEEMRIFVTTQLVDEARHTIFFSRFFREVMGVEAPQLEEQLSFARQYMNENLKYILIEALTEVAERIRQEPGNMAHLVEGITLYHVVIEGTMALAGQRGILEQYRRFNIFPAFRGGFTAVARDESRHVVFGVKFLRDMIQRDNANARVVQAAIEKYAPTSIEAISPAPEQVQRMLANQLDPWITPRYAVESLVKKLRVVGLSMNLPIPEIPPEPVFAQ